MPLKHSQNEMQDGKCALYCILFALDFLRSGVGGPAASCPEFPVLRHGCPLIQRRPSRSVPCEGNPGAPIRTLSSRKSPRACPWHGLARFPIGPFGRTRGGDGCMMARFGTIPIMVWQQAGAVVHRQGSWWGGRWGWPLPGAIFEAIAEKDRIGPKSPREASITRPELRGRMQGTLPRTEVWGHCGLIRYPFGLFPSLQPIRPDDAPATARGPLAVDRVGCEVNATMAPRRVPACRFLWACPGWGMVA